MVLAVAFALVVALMGPAGADVHGVSQANCGKSDSSGATQSRDAEGRPEAPIPADASDGRTQGRGGAADAQGQNC